MRKLLFTLLFVFALVSCSDSSESSNDKLYTSFSNAYTKICDDKTFSYSGSNSVTYGTFKYTKMVKEKGDYTYKSYTVVGANNQTLSTVLYENGVYRSGETEDKIYSEPLNLIITLLPSVKSNWSKGNKTSDDSVVFYLDGSANVVSKESATMTLTLISEDTSYTIKNKMSVSEEEYKFTF